MNHSDAEIFGQSTASAREQHGQTQIRRPNFMGVLGLVAVVVGYAPQFDLITSVCLWMIGMIAGFISVFQPGRWWGILAVIGGSFPMFVTFAWLVENYDQLVADGYFGEVTTEVVAQSESVDDATAEPVEPAKHWIEIKSPRGGYVEVYIGMPSEEVKKLLGRPKSVTVNTYGDEVHEDWRYDLSGYSWITIDFRDGKLRSVHQL